MRPYDVLLHVIFWLCLVFTVALAAGCGGDEDNAGAGALTGSGVEVNCQRRNLDKVQPGSLGDVRVDVICPGSGVVATP